LKKMDRGVKPDALAAAASLFVDPERSQLDA
jgi:hypothetical protein